MEPHRTTIGLVLSAALALLAGGAERPLDAAAVVARNLEARGGEAAWRAIGTARVRGTLSFGQGSPTPFLAEFKRPAKLRFELEVEGRTAVHAYDGEQGWALVPTVGRGRPEPMDAEQLAAIREQAESIEGPLLFHRDKGYAVELVGTASVDGNGCYELRISRGGEELQHCFVDRSSFLELRRSGESRVEGRIVPYTLDLGDYRRLDGVLLAYRYVRSYEGSAAPQTLRFETVELGVPIDDDRFAMPHP